MREERKVCNCRKIPPITAPILAKRHVALQVIILTQLFVIFRFLNGEGVLYRGADKSLARPGRKQANVSVRMASISFGVLPCRGKKNLMTARVSMSLKSCASLIRFRACFLPGRAKDLSAPRYTAILRSGPA